MANISTLLASILSARYGKDMRQHLHDAIKAVNDDTEGALGSSLAFNTSTRKLSLKAKNNTPLSEVVIPGGGSGGGSVDSVNGIFPDENGDVTVGLGDVDAVELSEPTNGQVLKFNGTNWVNANESGVGGTSDYTDLTNKPSINGVTLSGNKTSADLSISGGSNENLLDNPWFTVNQRGFTNATPTVNVKTYFADRFYCFFSGTGGSIARNNDGTITFTKYASSGRLYIYQKIENMSRFLGKNMTISLEMGDGTIYKVTRNTPTGDRYIGANVENTDTHTLYVGFSYGSNYYDADSIFIEIELKSGVEINVSKTIKAMKLEIGTESTLALDVAPDYATELLKCQRFYVPLKGYFSGIQLTNATLPIQLSVPMRTTPTISVGGDVIGMVGGTATQGTIQSASVVGLYGNQAVVSLSMIDAYNSALTFDSKTVFNAGLTSGYLSAEL